MTKKIMYLLLLALLTTTTADAQFLKNLVTGNKSNSGNGGSKQKGTLVDDEPGEGITGMVHQKYLGTIALDTKRISRADMNSDTTRFKTKFTLGQPIYGRVFLPHPLAKYRVWTTDGFDYENKTYGSASETHSFFIMEVDGKDVFEGRRATLVNDLNPEEDGKYITTFQMLLIPNAEDGGADEDLVKELNKLAAGDHKVRIICWAGMHGNRQSKEPVAEVTFTLTVPAGGAAMKIGRTFEALEAGMEDADLTAKILKATQRYAKNSGWKETFTKAKISSTKWYVERNKVTGIIIARSVDAWVYATWPDGHCTYQVFGFKEDHDGTAYQTDVYLEGVGDQTTCDCSK